MNLHIEIPFLEPFLEICDFEIHGFSIPLIYPELGGSPLIVRKVLFLFDLIKYEFFVFPCNKYVTKVKKIKIHHKKSEIRHFL